MSLSRPSAIITGAGSGINFAFAQLLYRSGHNVAIADIALRPESEALIRETSISPEGPKVVFVKTDVTKWKDLENAFEEAERKFGGVPDLVCPGAGIYEPTNSGFWADNDEDSHYRILDVNLVHPIKMTRMAIRRILSAQKKGTIVHIASIAAETVSLTTPLYAASKHSLASFIRGMAGLEEMCGIRVVGVAPGAIATPLLLEDRIVSNWLDLDKDKLLDPAVVAQALMAVAQNKGGRYPAGTVLEVADEVEDLWRPIPLYNNPGPQGSARFMSNKDNAMSAIEKKIEQEGAGSA